MKTTEHIEDLLRKVLAGHLNDFNDLSWKT